MFTDSELKATKDCIKRKKADVLEAGNKISDLEYIKSLQTLVKLEDAVNQRIQETSS